VLVLSGSLELGFAGRVISISIGGVCRGFEAYLSFKFSSCSRITITVITVIRVIRVIRVNRYVRIVRLVRS
jgi:hypothetical protein